MDKDETLFILTIGAFVIWIGMVFLAPYLFPNKKK
jgi:hypothetical protein